MQVNKISNLNFNAMWNPKLKPKFKQQIKILNPEPVKQEDPDKILLVMSNSPVFVCTNLDDVHSFALEPNRGFVQSIYTPLDGEDNCDKQLDEEF